MMPFVLNEAFEAPIGIAGLALAKRPRGFERNLTSSLIIVIDPVPFHCFHHTSSTHQHAHICRHTNTHTRVHSNTHTHTHHCIYCKIKSHRKPGVCWKLCQQKSKYLKRSTSSSPPPLNEIKAENSVTGLKDIQVGKRSHKNGLRWMKGEGNQYKTKINSSEKWRGGQWVGVGGRASGRWALGGWRVAWRLVGRTGEENGGSFQCNRISFFK